MPSPPSLVLQLQLVLTLLPGNYREDNDYQGNSGADR